MWVLFFKLSVNPGVLKMLKSQCRQAEIILWVYKCIRWMLKVGRKANQKGRHKIGSINNNIQICMDKRRRSHKKTRNEIDEEACKKRRSSRIARKFNFSKVYTGDQIKVTADDDDLQIIDKDVYHKELKGTFCQPRRPTHSPQDVESPSDNHIVEGELPRLLDQDELPLEEDQEQGMAEEQQKQCIKAMQLKRPIERRDSRETSERLRKKLKLNQKMEQQVDGEAEGQPLMIDSADVSECLKHSQSPLQKQIERSIEELQLISCKTKAGLKQKVAQEIQSLLQSDPLPLREIFNEDSVDVSLEQLPHAQNVERGQLDKKEEVMSTCANCQRNGEIQSQLKELFSELLLKEIDLDQLFLEQELLLILDNLNPAASRSTAKIQKLIDITDNRLLCELILQRVGQGMEQANIFQQYLISKMVRVNSEWFAILQPGRVVGAVRDHFKYLPARELLSVHRERLVSFLIG